MGPIAGYSNNHDLAGRQSAAKTGTAQLGDTGQNKDAWMIGSTPQLATAVWMGNVNGQPLVDMTYGGPMYGSKSPADIWKNFMDAALVNEPAENFEGGVAADTSTGGGGGGGGWTGGYESTPQEDTQEGPAEEAPAPQDNGGGAGEGGGELPDVGQMIEDFLNGGN